MLQQFGLEYFWKDNSLIVLQPAPKPTPEAAPKSAPKRAPKAAPKPPPKVHPKTCAEVSHAIHILSRLLSRTFLAFECSSAGCSAPTVSFVNRLRTVHCMGLHKRECPGVNDVPLPVPMSCLCLVRAHVDKAHVQTARGAVSVKFWQFNAVCAKGGMQVVGVWMWVSYQGTQGRQGTISKKLSRCWETKDPMCGVRKFAQRA